MRAGAAAPITEDRPLRRRLVGAGAVLLAVAATLACLALAIPRRLTFTFDHRPNAACVSVANWPDCVCLSGVDWPPPGTAATPPAPRATPGAAILSDTNEIRLRTGPRGFAVRMLLSSAGPPPDGRAIRVGIAVEGDVVRVVTLTPAFEWVALPVRLPHAHRPLRISVVAPNGAAALPPGGVRVAQLEAASGGAVALAPVSVPMTGWLTFLFLGIGVSAWALASVAARLAGRSAAPWHTAAAAAAVAAAWLAVVRGPVGLLWFVPELAAHLGCLAAFLVLSGCGPGHVATAGFEAGIESWRPRCRWFLAAAALVLAAFLFDGLFTGRVLSQSDTLYRFYPWAAYLPPGFTHPGNVLMGDIPQMFHPWLLEVRSAIRSGHLLTWSPYMFAGHPFLGAYQPAVFSPFTAIGVLLPLPAATGWMAFARLLVGGAGMFVFVRSLGCRWPAAAFGGLMFLLNPFSVMWLEHPVAPAMSWLPWLLWAGARAASGTSREMAVLALLVCLELTSGHPETSFKVVLLTGSYAVLCAWTGSGGPAPSLRRRLAATGRIAGAHLLGAMVLAVQLLPSYEYVVDSRSFLGRSATGLNPFTVPATTLITALVPAFFGRMPDLTFQLQFTRTNPCEMQVYAGMVTWLLAAAAVAWQPRDRRTWFFGGAALLGGAAMYGLPGMHQLLSVLPVFKVTVLSRFGLVVIASAIVLASIGFDRLLDRPTGPDRPRRRAACVVGALTVGIVGAMLVALAWFRPSLAGLHILGVSVRATAAAATLALGAGTVIALALTGRTTRAATVPTLLGLATLDLFAVGYGFHPAMRADQVFPPVPEITRLQREPGLFRVGGWGDALAPNAAQAYRLQDFRGYDGIWPYRYDDLLAEDFGVERPFQKATDRRAIRLLDLLNVRYIFASPGDALPADHFTRLNWGRAPLYRNEGAFPRAFLVGTYRVATPLQARQLVRGPGLDLSQVVVLEEELAPGDRPEPAASRVDTAIVTEYTPESVSVRVDAGGRRLLVLSDRYDPGWTATLDGREVPIHRADYAFRAVAVPAGSHEVVFRYVPRSMRTGGAISLVAGLVILALMIPRSARRT